MASGTLALPLTIGLVSNSEFFPGCSSTSCPPPLLCTADPAFSLGGSVCEYPCSSTNPICPNPQTVCVLDAGACELNGCDPSNPITGGLNTAATPNGACDVSGPGAGDGTCLPFLFGTVAIPGESSPATDVGWACSGGGTADGGCLWPGLLSTPATTCAQNQVCVTTSDVDLLVAAANVPPNLPEGTCAPLCAFDGGACAAGSCVGFAATGYLTVILGQYSDTGACLLDGGGGCSLGLAGTEGEPCLSSANCSCPQTCQVDSAELGPLCKSACKSDIDCPSAGETCVGGLCSFRYCGALPDGGEAAGTYNGACTVDAGNDGTCLPVLTSNNDARTFYQFGICYLNGTATTVCDDNFSWNAAALCEAGSTCVLGGCAALCDPTMGGSCDAGACSTLNGNGFVPAGAPPTGVCLGACQASGVDCFNNGDCCSGACVGPNHGGPTTTGNCQ